MKLHVHLPLCKASQMSRLILNLHTLPENKINTGRHRESHTRGDSAVAHVIHMETTRRSNTITSQWEINTDVIAITAIQILNPRHQICWNSTPLTWTDNLEGQSSLPRFSADCWEDQPGLHQPDAAAVWTRLKCIWRIQNETKKSTF